MSLRHLRKLVGPNTLPPPEDSSDEDYEPLYVKNSASKFTYAGLELSSHTESENDSDAVVADSPEPETSSKKKKKRKKKNQKQQNAESVPKEDGKELDEIDKSVREVNALLGTPPPAPPPVEKPPPDPKIVLFSCQQKHLNEANEVFSSYHPDPSEPKARRRHSHEANRLLKRAVIIPLTEPAIKFPKSGLSMSLIRRDENCKYFAFDHSKDYQAKHRQYLNSAVYGRESPVLSLEELRKNMHVESLLEAADYLFRHEAYSEAKTVIEYAVAYMQHAVHPMFNFTDNRVRLEYKIAENRPFHIAVLKYLHLLSNKACHRTALELAKLLLNLDPSDPLGILSIIDTLALRARQHQWLIDAVEYLSETRDAGKLYNMQYSRALAHFHVATKNKEDLSKADELIQEAILRFPTLALNLLELAGIKPADSVVQCNIFQTAEKSTPKFLGELLSIYAKFTVSRWRETPVLEWFKRNLAVVVDRFSKEREMVLRAHDLRMERMTLFRGRPGEIMRHLSIIQPMAMLLIESEIFTVPRSRNVDPFPPEDGISRYGYGAMNNAITEALEAMNSPLYELFASILPHYDLPRQIERNLMEVRREAEAIGVEEARNNPDWEEQFEFVPDQYDVLNEDNDDTTDDDGDAEHPDRPRFIVSVETLTDAVRRLIGIHERSNSSTDQDNPQPGQSSDPELPIEEHTDGNTDLKIEDKTDCSIEKSADQTDNTDINTCENNVPTDEQNNQTQD